MAPTGNTKKVREWLAATAIDGRICSGTEIGQALGLTPRLVQRVIAEMVMSGEVERVCHGRYQYAHGPGAKASPQVVRPRILRAMHTLGSFSCADIALIADARRDYVERTARRLTESGDLERVCQRPNAQNVPCWVYRVRHRDEFYLAFVRAGEPRDPRAVRPGKGGGK
jgi:hypothetical protein